MIAIEQGVELDRAVAEAIGWSIIAGFPHDWHDERGRTWPISGFRPSYDMNAAFAAAERVFPHGFALHTPGVPVGGWKEFRCIAGTGWDGDRASGQIQVEADTPALAICAAILKLKEKS